MKSYEAIKCECDVCGNIDDLSDVQSAIRYRIIDDGGEVLYVCVRCAAESFLIEEAMATLREYGYE